MRNSLLVAASMNERIAVPDDIHDKALEDAFRRCFTDDSIH